MDTEAETQRSGRSVELDALLDAVPEAMLALDAQGVVVAANSRCEPLLGYPPAELVGQPVEALVPVSLRDLHLSCRTAYVEQPHVRDSALGPEFVAVRKNGSEVGVEITLAPLATAEGPLVLATVREAKRSHRDERLFRRFLEAAPDALVVVDDAGGIILVNAQAEELFGYSRAELLGRSVEMLVPDRFAGPHSTFRGEFVEHPRVRPIGLAGGLYGKHRDGREFPVEIALSPLQTEEGLMILADVRDISERLEVVEAIHAAEERQRLQTEDQRMKDEFLATVSHELRTPLASILGYTELIVDHEELDPELEHFITVIMRNARRELRLVDDLLMLVNIDRRGLLIHAEDADLVRVVRDAVDSARPQADVGGLLVEVDVPPAPLVVGCDADRIGEALDSLLSNALKFTPPGGRVDVRLYATETMARIEVSDSGVGIGTSEHHRVFERLYRSPTAIAREVPGAGLGLSIAAAIIEAHHGDIRVLRTDESGTTFGLQIPLVP
jgi:protein-histidine pros-kinase